MKQKPTADDVRRVALAALAAALEDGKEEAKKKPGMTGVRAVATGAVLYTAGRAAFSGRRFIRDHFGADGEAHDEADEEMSDDRDDDEDDDPRAEDDEDYEDEDDEPRAEEDEDYEDEDDEPRAEEDEDYEDEDDEPRAEEDDDYEDEDDEPRAEEDEDYEDEDDEPRAEEDDEYEDEEEDEPVSSRRPPSHPKRSSGDQPPADLPTRPSRSRAPVGLS
jgi:hypothetical protein